MRINPKHLFIVILVFVTPSNLAQVGIGTNTPAEGLMIYQTSAPAGFYY
jgi:hypothetical protein